MVQACESIFSRTSLDARPRNLHTFSKVNLKYTKHTFPVGQARCSFHLPHSYNLQILLARGNGASTNVEPWDNNVEMCCSVCAVDNADLNMNLKYPFNIQIVNQTFIIHQATFINIGAYSEIFNILSIFK